MFSRIVQFVRDRIRYPWPLWKRVGGIQAVVIRADGTKEDLGQVSHAYARRWRASSGR